MKKTSTLTNQTISEHVINLRETMHDEQDSISDQADMIETKSNFLSTGEHRREKSNDSTMHMNDHSWQLMPVRNMDFVSQEFDC